MANAHPRGTARDELVDFLFDDRPDDPLAVELAGWLAASAQFRAFTATYRDKVRKKLRGARDAGSRLDLRSELRVAHLLLADERIGLEFEASGSATGGPDFAVTHRGRTVNVEVTRLRRPADPVGIGRAVLAKLRQLPPSVPNMLLLSTEATDTDPHAVDAAAKALRARADARDDAFFARHGLPGGRGFYDRFLRLGAVLLWAEHASGDDRLRLWINASARIESPPRAVRAIVARLQAN